MDGGYFGAADVVTPIGAAYSGVAVLMAAAAIASLYRWPRLAGWLVPLTFSVSAGVFVPPVVADPLVAGIVVVWNLVALTQAVFPAVREIRPAAVRLSPLETRLAREAPALRYLALIALALTVAVVGYRLSDRRLTEGVCLLLGYGTLLAALPLLRSLAREGSRLPWLVAVPAVVSLLALRRPTLALALVAVAQVLLLAALWARTQGTAELLHGFYRNPPRLIGASFATLVLIGTVLLTFPAASAGALPVAPLDALFTATSAVCVTGLVVLDTPNAFSPFGHGVILALIQVGGLGIMVLSTFAALLLGGSLGLRGESALTEVLDLQAVSTAYRLTRFIVLATLAVEAVGAAGLTLCFSAAGLELPAALWRGVFHAVSAFCNAGFALQSDSVAMFQSSPAGLLLVAALVILGGLGFAVLAAVWWRLRRSASGPLTVQVRIVLAASSLLLAAGTAIFAAVEWDRSLAGLPLGERLLNAFFQSVTLRTAGFNSVSFDTLAPATVLIMLGFMFIGASPGSTGGGIKTTTAAVLLAAIRSTIRPSEPVRLFGREVPREIVDRSVAIGAISAAVTGAALFLLLVVERQPFLDLLFEVISAFGTVGLSLGATGELGPAGKLTIIALMFVGRIGPLTLALLLGAGAAKKPAVRYPQTRLMVG